MPMWRCPHCGTPQAETARCWVCRRSSTACASCRHFRRSIAGTLGYCGLDPRRAPLHGDEIRSCWEAQTGEPEPVASAPGTAPYLPPPMRAPVTFADHSVQREFVEVGTRPAPGPRRRTTTIPAVAPDQATATAASATSATDGSAPGDEHAASRAANVTPSVSDGEPRWNLWGELDR